jgi:hypothetical protein
MTTKITNLGPKLSEAELVKFEEQIGFTLPESYRNFLLVYNGGEPSPYFHKVPKWHFQQSLVVEFKGIDPCSEYVDLGEAIELLQDRLPKGFIPIGGDPGGNYVLISLDGSTRGKIYFWDHEDEPEDCTENLSDYPNIYWLADDFKNFLNNLKEEDELETSDRNNS